jgi:hypothetical protein
MSSPIQNRIGSLFIPVADVAKARDWYCRILGLPVQGFMQENNVELVGDVRDDKFFAFKDPDGNMLMACAE